MARASFKSPVVHPVFDSRLACVWYRNRRHRMLDSSFDVEETINDPKVCNKETLLRPQFPRNRWMISPDPAGKAPSQYVHEPYLGKTTRSGFSASPFSMDDSIKFALALG